MRDWKYSNAVLKMKDKSSFIWTAARLFKLFENDRLIIGSKSFLIVIYNAMLAVNKWMNTVHN